jgi:hypothetical protein
MHADVIYRRCDRGHSGEILRVGGHHSGLWTFLCVAFRNKTSLSASILTGI